MEGETMMELAKESMFCWKDTIICFICAVFLGPVSTVLVVVIYYLLNIVCSLLCYALQVSPPGWKDKSTLEKLVIVVKVFVGQVLVYFGFSQPNLVLFFTNLGSKIWQKAKKLVAAGFAAIAAGSGMKGLARDEEVNAERIELLKQISEACEESRCHELQRSDDEAKHQGQVEEKNALLLKQMETLATAFDSSEAREKASARADRLQELLDESREKNEALEAAVSNFLKHSDQLQTLLDESEASKTDLEKRISELSELLFVTFARSDKLFNLWHAAQVSNKTLQKQVSDLKSKQARAEIAKLNETMEELEMDPRVSLHLRL